MKFCIFCGKKPEAKNKEHVIPQWLIRMTGDPNREIVLGFDSRHFRKTGESKVRKYNFGSFQFPACEKCNTKYSDLEKKVSVYFKRIFEQDYFNRTEIDTLLDWFDKVRIGLWLGYILLDEIVEQVLPKFHIEKRIGHRDRALFVYELEDDGMKGVQFIGASPGFHFIPSCFTLRVNNVMFFNYSFDFLFSEQIGFPFPKFFAQTDTPERFMAAEFEKGSKRVNLPLIRQKFLKASNYIYQPMLPPELLKSNSLELQELYDNDYVKANCINFAQGRGGIFYFDKGLQFLDEDSELQLYTNSQKLDGRTFPKRLCVQTLETLENLLKIKPNTEMLNKERGQNIEQNRITILHMHQDMLRLYKQGKLG